MKNALEMSPFVLSSHKNSALIGRIVTEIAALSTEHITATSAFKATNCCHPGTPSVSTSDDAAAATDSSDTRSVTAGPLACARTARREL